MIKIYLDNCMFNRPFDDQNQIRIRLETEAKLYIQSKIKQGTIALVWSYILEFENMNNPFEERRNTILKWKGFAKENINETKEILKKAQSLKQSGIKSKDALHAACAIEAGVNYFITTDDVFIKKINKIKEMLIINPLDLIDFLEEKNDY